MALRMLMLGAGLAVVVAACGANTGEAPVTPTSESASSESSQQPSPTSGAASESADSAVTTTVTMVDESTPESEEQDNADSEDLTPVTSAVEQSGDTSPPGTEGPIEGGFQPLVQMAVDDLASRLSMSPDDIVVMQAVSVVWPDGSLGCPQPGMVYTQTLVDGFHILLQANGATYSYQGGGTSPEPFLCENPKLP